MNTEFTNTQGERIDIDQITRGEFKGQHVLRIYDDADVSDTVAIHLLDKETIDWLSNALACIPLER